MDKILLCWKIMVLLHNGERVYGISVTDADNSALVLKEMFNEADRYKGYVTVLSEDETSTIFIKLSDIDTIQIGNPQERKEKED